MAILEIDLERDIVDGAVRKVYQSFRVASAGAVGTFARLTSRAVLRIMTRAVGFDLVPREEPDAVDVPVVHYAGGGYGVWMDMRQGDPAVVVCCDGPVRGFYETGTAVTPAIGQSHTYGTSVAFPGGRVSATEVPTPPPNAAGELLMGAADGSAAVVVRGAGLPSPAELGTVVVQAGAPVAAVRLGADTASLGVARLGDPVAASAATGTVLSALAAFANGIVPGTVNPVTLAQALAELGSISGASTTVVST